MLKWIGASLPEETSKLSKDDLHTNLELPGEVLQYDIETFQFLFTKEAWEKIDKACKTFSVCFIINLNVGEGCLR